VNKNYEILLSDDRNLLDCNYFDTEALKALYIELYKEDDKFLPDNTKINLAVFKQRLKHLIIFHAKAGKESRPVERLLRTLSFAYTKKISIESVTGRIFDDSGMKILSRQLMIPTVGVIIKNFCCKREINKKQLIEAVKSLKIGTSPTEFLTTKQVAKMLGISHAKVAKDAKENVIQYCTKAGKTYLFHTDNVETYKKHPLFKPKTGRKKQDASD